MHNNSRFGQGIQNDGRFPSYMFEKSKRIRNKNWEILEIQVLKKMIDNHYDLLNSRHTNAMMNARKNLVWKRIAESINALGLHKRTIRELKIKWSNIRLTERRKSDNHTSHDTTSASGVGVGDGGSGVSDDIVDISQSSIDSDNQSDRIGSNVQDNFTTPERTNTPATYSDSARTNNDSFSPNDTIQDRNQHLVSPKESQRHEQVERFYNSTEHVSVRDRLHPSSVAEDESTIRRSSSWSNQDYVPCQTEFRPPQRAQIPDFSQDRIYMPGTVIKPEPKEYSHTGSINGMDISQNQMNDVLSSSSQTEWSLSSFQNYDCPSLNVPESDFTCMKYDILQLERENLRLKNQNIELQNAKLRIEIAKLQNS